MGAEIAPGKELPPRPAWLVHTHSCAMKRGGNAARASRREGFWRRGGFGFPKTCGNVIFAIDKELGMVYTVVRLQDGS